MTMSGSRRAQEEQDRDNDENKPIGSDSWGDDALYEFTKK
jgi:hypothetical protein